MNSVTPENRLTVLMMSEYLSKEALKGWKGTHDDYNALPDIRKKCYQRNRRLTNERLWHVLNPREMDYQSRQRRTDSWHHVV
jgi:hypothetical protein